MHFDFGGFDFGGARAGAGRRHQLPRSLQPVFPRRECRAGGAQRARARHRPRISDRNHFWEAMRGTVKKLSFTRLDVCNVCHGTGVAPGDEKVCTTCGGTGQVTQTSGKMRFQLPARAAAARDNCAPMCRNCGGEGRVRRVETLEVRIPPGAQTGSRVRVAGHGNAGTAWRASGRSLHHHEGGAASVFRPARRRSLHGRARSRCPKRRWARRWKCPRSTAARRCAFRPAPTAARSCACARRACRRSRQPGKRGDQIVEVQVVVPKPEDERVRNLLKELEQDRSGRSAPGIFRARDGL